MSTKTKTPDTTTDAKLNPQDIIDALTVELQRATNRPTIRLRLPADAIPDGVTSYPTRFGDLIITSAPVTPKVQGF